MNKIKLKLSTAFSAYLFFAFFCAGNLNARVITWGSPGNEIQSSKDYEVTVKQAGELKKLFAYYSFNRSVDKVLEDDPRYFKHSLFRMHATQYVDPEKNNDTYAHSWAYFDFDEGPVEVEVKINQMVGVSFPLKSCGVFPEYHNIQCTIVNGNTVKFTMDKPAKIAIVPNYKEAQDTIIRGGKIKAYEGYRNPLFLFAREPEQNVPDKNSKGTLIIKPGQKYNQEAFNKAKLIWFEPGIHDYSVTGNKDNYIVLNESQQMYLAGGSYVYCHVSAQDKRILISKMPEVFGRGTISGLKNIWNSTPYVITEIRGVKLTGIHLTDPHNHISHSVSPFNDVAITGAWHGNTDGLTVENGVPDDPFMGYNVNDCFVMAGDTNLKFRGKARIRNYVIWQLGNAEPYWIADSQFAEVSDVDVLYYGKASDSPAYPGQAINVNVISGRNINKVYSKNIRINVPFLGRLFLLTSAYKGNGAALTNVIFENLSINTPVIQHKSPIGNISDGLSPFGKVVFKNVRINGVKLSEENFSDYFELLHDVQIGKEIVFE